MNKTKSLQSYIGSLIVAACITSLFYGDVWIGITVPLAVFFLLLAIPTSSITEIFRIRSYPFGIFLISSLAIIVLIQFLFGIGPSTRSNFIVYLPLIYACLSIFVTSRIYISDYYLYKSIIIGSSILFTIMTFAAIFVGPGQHFLPSQHIPAAYEIFGNTGSSLDHQKDSPTYERPAAETETETETETSTSSTTSTNTAVINEAYYIDDFSRLMYGWKSSLQTPLGFSNYIAVFFVFGVATSLFSGRYFFATLLTIATISTLSRNGLIFLIAVYILWGIRYWRGWSPYFANTAIILSCLLPLIVYISTPILQKFPQSGSLLIRVAHWEGAIEAIQSFWISGAARSVLMETINVGVYWNPHNSILWISALFGLAGLLIYAAYSVLALREIAGQAKSSPLWQGIYVGVCIIIGWGMLDVMALAPSYEMLIAMLYGITFQRRGQNQPAL